jgi:hypothetical protein
VRNTGTYLTPCLRIFDTLLTNACAIQAHVSQLTKAQIGHDVEEEVEKARETVDAENHGKQTVAMCVLHAYPHTYT